MRSCAQAVKSSFSGSVRVLLAVIFVSISSYAFAAEDIHPYVRYDMSETIRTESDHRDRLTTIYLNAGNDVGFRYREDVFGSADNVVKAVEFSNEYKVKASKEEQAQLVQALLDAKVFHLVSDPKPPHFFDVRPMPGPAYYAGLDVRIEEQDKQFGFFTYPVTAQRAAIHKIIFDFAKRMKLDQPEDLSKATFISPGDLEPAQPVQFSDLLERPDAFHGKRVAVIGYRHFEFEGNRLCLDKQASEKPDYKKCIWSGGVSTFADPKKLNGKDDTMQQVEGIFYHGPDGLIMGWRDSIQRITSSKTIGQSQ